MNRLLLCVCCMMLCMCSFAQVPDFISVRKPNGRTIKHIMTGMPVQLQQKNGDYLQGNVVAIRNDSVWVRVYLERRMMSSWGVPQVDTLGSVTRRLHYQEIDRVFLNKRYSFWRRQGPVLLLLGGGGYVLLNVVNGAISGESVGDQRNLRRLGTAAAIGTAGFILRKLFPVDGFSRRRHHIVYINMQVKKRPM